MSPFPRVLVQATRHFSGCFAMKPHDTVLASFPRSGSTWFRTIFANAINLNNGIDETVTFRDLEDVMPVLGYSNLWINNEVPRLIKTHRLHKEIKPFRPQHVFHLWRNPVDVMKSCFRYYSASNLVSIEDSFSAFLRNKSYGMPAWRSHYLSWHKRATTTLRYEEMRRDPITVFSTTFQDLGFDDLVQHVEHAVELASLARMKKSESRDGIRDPERFNADFSSIGQGQEDDRTLDSTDLDYVASLSNDIPGCEEIQKC